MGLFNKLFGKKEKTVHQYDDSIKEMDEYFQSAPEIAEEIVNVFTNGSPEEIEKYRKENHITDEDIKIHHNNIKQMQYEEDLFEIHYQRNQEAKALEKTNVNKAIQLYERNVNEGCIIPETYNRLGMLYRKQKKFDDVVRVYEVAGNVIGNKRQRYNKSYYDGLIKKIKE